MRGLTRRRANGVKDPLLVFSPARPGRRWDVIYLRLLTLIFPPSTRKRPTLRSTMTRVAFPYGICAVLLLPSLYWIARDRAVWLWDQAWYGEVSVDLWYLLVHHPVQWQGAATQAFGIKAPGIAWVVVCSRVDGRPNAVMEAQAMSSEDVRGFVRAILDLSSDRARYEQMRQSARPWAERHFSLRGSVDEYVRLLRGLAGKENQRPHEALSGIGDR